MTYRVFAVAAHPDDIEFCMAGSLILLARAGCELHYMNVANGSCGSIDHDAAATAALRLEESQNAAARLGAVFHPPIAADLELFYEKHLLSKMASIMRAVAPDILCVPSPQDYMEDHMTTCRLAITAAFCRGMGNFPVDPPMSPVFNQVTVYHSQPFGNRDGLNRLIQPDFFVDIGEVMEEKAAMLAEHKTQKTFLDKTQGMDAYLDEMRSQAREMGNLSKKCTFAEGWRRHNPLGLCSKDADPMLDVLRTYVHE